MTGFERPGQRDAREQIYAKSYRQRWQVVHGDGQVVNPYKMLLVLWWRTTTECLFVGHLPKQNMLGYMTKKESFLTGPGNVVSTCRWRVNLKVKEIHQVCTQ